MLTLILGGTRSGKSRPATACYVATAGEDAGIMERIPRHRNEQLDSWQAIEKPLVLSDAVERLATCADTASKLVHLHSHLSTPARRASSSQYDHTYFQ